MAVYVMTGRLGSGKTLISVKRIRDYLRNGAVVATNLDLNVEHLLPLTNKTARLIRLPDKPAVHDFIQLGEGSDSVDESKHGLIVLDELGTWLNAREWGDKGRKDVIDWLVQCRKWRWDVIFICQSVNMIDKQIRDALVELHVHCKRLDRVKIPLFGAVGRLLTLGLWNGRIGKVHLGVVVDVPNSTANSPTVVDRWIYRGHDLYKAYNTEQKFSSGGNGAFSYLTPWHLLGHSYVPPLTFRQRLASCFLGASSIRVHPSLLKPKTPFVRRLEKLPPDIAFQCARRACLRADGVLLPTSFAFRGSSCRTVSGIPT